MAGEAISADLGNFQGWTHEESFQLLVSPLSGPARAEAAAEAEASFEHSPSRCPLDALRRAHASLESAILILGGSDSRHSVV